MASDRPSTLAPSLAPNSQSDRPPSSGLVPESDRPPSAALTPESDRPRDIPLTPESDRPSSSGLDPENDRPGAWGTLYGISAGPGDPELITVKGLGYLQQCPIVAFPAGRDDRPGMAQQIIQRWLLPHQQPLPLYFPYVRPEETATLEAAWQAAAQTVGIPLSQGQDVAFVAEGDVSFYSTFGYLAQAVEQAYPQVTIVKVPGVCSPLAAAAVAGQPLTVWQQRLWVLPGLYQVEALGTALDRSEVVVVMKFSSVYGQVWRLLEARGLLARSYIVERCGWPDERLYRDLTAYPQLSLSYFSVLVVAQG